MAYVQGDKAEAYHFTSTLPSQLLKALLPQLAAGGGGAGVALPLTATLGVNVYRRQRCEMELLFRVRSIHERADARPL